MSRVIVIRWNSDSLRATVIRAQSASAEVLSEFTIPWDIEAEEGEHGVARQLADGLASFSSGRVAVVLAVGRELLDWQHLSLPPCPVEDLPEMVRLQADYSHSASDSVTGLDFLPLVGDVDSPHRVWAISLSAPLLAKLRRVMHTAELSMARLVPLSLGWPAWVKHSMEGGNRQASIFIAPQGEEPLIWATVGKQIVMFRQVHLPDHDESARTTALTVDLRRTLLAFNQDHAEAGAPVLKLVGNDRDELLHQSDVLSTQLGQQVEAVAPEIPSGKEGQGSLPVLGLALDEAAGQVPLIDLLHPRRPPAPRTGRRTYVLAAVAAASLAVLIGLIGYERLQAPLDAAALAQAEIDLLEESSDRNRTFEQQATSVRNWLSSSVNLLDELQTLSLHVRPEPLDAEEFPVDDDIVLAKITLQGKQFVIDALAKENSDVQPVEYRLRDGSHRVRRGKTEQSEAQPGYPLSFQAIVDVDPGEATGR